MYRKILLAYDGSEEGAQALREGALLARAFGAEVVLLCVAPETTGVMMAEGLNAGVVGQLADSYQTLLDHVCARLTQLGCSHTPRFEHGEPCPIIGMVAQEMGADLVVVGHHKQNVLSRWWSGSNDSYLIDHVGCTLVISSNHISDEAFEAELRMAAV